jgi:hypothetical protein
MKLELTHIPLPMYLFSKDYYGSVEYSAMDSVYHGSLIGITSFIAYEGETLDALYADFETAVDDYLDSCRRFGDVPEIPFDGKRSGADAIKEQFSNMEPIAFAVAA